MMKAQFLLLCVAVIPAISAWSLLKQCPELPANSEEVISYKQIGGDWKLTASKPALNKKCMNVTIHDYSLTETYYSKILYIWNKLSTTEYTILNAIKPVALDLKSKAWYNFKTEKLYLIGVNYNSFALFYSCSPGLFSYSDTYELWTRDEVDSSNLPAGIAERLALFKLKPEQLTFRAEKDCSH